MEFGLVGLALLQALSSVVFAFAVVCKKAKLHEKLNYNSQFYDCADPVKTLVEPSAENGVVFFSSRQPCVYPDISTPILTSQSTGFKIFNAIGISIRERGLYDN